MYTGTLQFLTEDDLRLLDQKAQRQRYQPNERILEEGSLRQGLFVVREGTVRVQQDHSGHPVTYATLGPGDLFGEMSFLEHTGASASVYADDEVETDLYDGHHVNALMTSVPGFAARFYQSLAISLAHRLRETSRLIPPLLVEDIPQTQRNQAPRKMLYSRDHMPRHIIDACKSFKHELLRLDRAIKEGAMQRQAALTHVIQACDTLTDSLRRATDQEPDMASAIGFAVLGEVFPYLMLSSRFSRAYTKPRGYAGDYETIIMLCREDAEGRGRIGPLIDEWIIGLSICRALRNRNALTANMIRDSASRFRGNGPAPVTTLNMGSAIELLDALSGSPKADIAATCFDTDSEAFTYVEQVAAKWGVRGRLSFKNANVLHLSLGKGEEHLQPQHLIYAVGLTEYLEDRFVVRLLDWVYGHLLPGGRFMMSSIDPSCPDRPFLDHILEWVLTYRSRHQLEALFKKSRFQEDLLEIQRDETGNLILITASKAS